MAKRRCCRVWTVAALLVFIGPVLAESPLKSLNTKHYRIHYNKKYEALAGKAAELSEAVWPTLAKAYEAYDNYQIIDVFVVDPGDVANGNAIYSFSRVFIFASHINWVMRGRRNWLGNVLTHELAHVFSLRRAAYLSPFDAVALFGGTVNRRTNYSFDLAWIPMVAPTWYVEGIAQLEAYARGYDEWDSQRDLIVRDAYLTKTLPSLGEIETFDGNWISGERVYNTGFAFLRYLMAKYGLEKVRKLAEPKPVFSFSYSVKQVMGKSLGDLFLEWKESLEREYAGFSDRLRGKVYLSSGDYNHSLAFSTDDRYVAWIGNDNRDAPMDYIYWKKLEDTQVTEEQLLQEPSSNYEDFYQDEEEYGEGDELDFQPFSVNPYYKGAKRQNAHRSSLHSIWGDGRSKQHGSTGLEFNRRNNRLLTTRRAKGSPYSDIWEYDFLNDEWERLTWNERASYASYHPSLDLILFVEGDFGSGNLAVLDSLGKTLPLTRFKEGQQVYNPRFNPAGDSIYFTLGIGEKEAIAALPLSARPFDPFEAIRDSAEFPDSTLMGKSEKLTFITSLDENLDRDLRFSGDTLFWSSYYGENVYNVFARLPGDSIIYQATNVPDQALEPVVHGGKLYYQGFKAQKFEIYEMDLRLYRSNSRMSPQDSLPVEREKTPKYSTVLESGEYKGSRVAWDITPYLSLFPQFINDTNLITNLGVGFQVAVGELTSYVSHVFDVHTSKEIDLKSPSNYSVAYSGRLNKPAIRHTKLSWLPQFQYGLRHLVVKRQSESRVSGLTELNVFPFDAYELDPLYDELIPKENPEIAGDLFLGMPIFTLNAARDSIIDTLFFPQVVFYDEELSIKEKNTYDQANYFTFLPLNFFTGGGYYSLRQSVSFQGYARNYLDIDYSIFPFNQYILPRFLEDSSLITLEELEGYLDSLNVTPEQYQAFLDSQDVLIWQGITDRSYDVPIHRHFRQILGWQGILYKYGEIFPTGLGGRVMVGKYWTTYADRVLYNDSLPGTCAIDGRACGTISFTQEQFAPWELSGAVFSAYSYEKLLTFRTYHEIGFFSEDFPTQGSGVPHSSLFPLYYRLGVYRLPGYPYNFSYGGRDIMRGTAMFYTGVALDLPYKIREYFDSPYSPFSSLNQIKLTLMGNAGTTLDKKPGDIIPALENEENELLFDFGFRFSLNFQIFHRLPMTMYFQMFYPVHNLKEERIMPYDLPSVDFDGNGRVEVYTVSQQTRLTGRVAGNDYLVGRKKVMDELNSPRLYFGLQLGRF